MAWPSGAVSLQHPLSPAPAWMDSPLLPFGQSGTRPFPHSAADTGVLFCGSDLIVSLFLLCSEPSLGGVERNGGTSFPGLGGLTWTPESPWTKSPPSLLDMDR